MKREITAAVVLLPLLAGAWTGALAAPPAGAPMAELDVAIETNLRETAEHRKAYLKTMLELARGALGGLVSPRMRDAATPPGDGAARYRLFIRHQGTVEVEQNASPAKTVGPAPAGVRKLLARQKGKFIFRLAKWTGARYPTLDQWSSEFATSHVLPIPANVTTEDMAYLRNEALLTAMPDAVSRGILDRILPIQLARTSGDPGKPKACTVTVENRSRWGLWKLAVEVIWCEQAGENRRRYRAEPQYEGLLAPARKIELKGTAAPSPSPLAWDYHLPAQITATPTFVPGGFDAAEGK